jgi:hypothetical protein
MKAFLGLSALAALCQSVYSLKSGLYTIGSASTEGKLVLTAHSGASGHIPLDFTPESGSSSQVWEFHATDKQYFVVKNRLGAFINCEGEGSVCVSGDQPQAFIPEFTGNDKYQLVEQGSGLFLRSDENEALVLAGYDTSPNEEFFLSPAPADGKAQSLSLLWILDSY